MIQVHRLSKAEGKRGPYLLVYTDPEHPDKTGNAILQGSERDILAVMENGGLTGEEIDRWFETANPSPHGRDVVKDLTPP
jgi:hypothetical protein